MTTIYVGNLSFKTTEDELLGLFSEYGDVESAKIITDRETGRSRGFGFIEMNDEDQAVQAIDDLHEADFMDRTLVVNKARPKSDNGFGGGRRNGGGGRGRY
ncbi:RNA-binding protein [Balneolaceae bacterium ANBcel3]|nr:RNA-binding protein [Balneolaceae bacterium ANBcel3]